MRSTAAVIELGNSHEECLESTLWFLSNHADIDLYVCTSLEHRISHLIPYCRSINIIKHSGKEIGIAASFLLARRIQKNAYTTIFLNTAQGRVKFFCFFSLFSSSQFVGILHNVRKLEKSFGQKIISKRLSQYLVLNDYLVESAQGLTNIPVNSYYPIFAKTEYHANIEKRQGQIWITTPGRVEYKRRDYQFLIQLARELRHLPEYKFVILGNFTSTSDGQSLIRQIQQEGLMDNFITFNTFIATTLFNEYLKKTDIIMPLITPAVIDFYSYQGSKITGSWNTAFAFKIPMLVHPSFLKHTDFKENAIAIDKVPSQEIILKLFSKCISNNTYTDPKWEKSYQERKFLKILNYL